MTCVNPRCFGTPRYGRNLCGYCSDVLDSAIVIGVCGGMCVLIIAAAKLGRML